MRILAYIGLLTVSFAASGVAGEEHPLDAAGQALDEERYEDAIRLYQEHVLVEPTVEGYNNLGVAFERSGRYEEAKAAYSSARSLPGVPRSVTWNSLRVRLRAILETLFPWCFGLAILCIVLSVFSWLIGWARTCWRAVSQRTRYRRVRLLNLTSQATYGADDLEPDGIVYPDSTSVRLRADLTVPKREDIYPLDIRFSVTRPDGSLYVSENKRIENPDQGLLSVAINIDDVDPLKDAPGNWSVTVSLENVPRKLGTGTFRVVDREALLADLRLLDARVVAEAEGQLYPTTVILEDSESLSPVISLAPRSCHPSKYAGMKLQVGLYHCSSGEHVDEFSRTLLPEDEAFTLCDVCIPIHGTPLAEKTGHWEFRISVEERQLATLPFALVSRDAARKSVKLERLDLVGTSGAGQAFPLGHMAYASSLRTISPVITLNTRYPVPWVAYDTVVGVCINEEPVGEVAGGIAFDENVIQFVPGEFTVPELPESDEPPVCTFVLLVEGRCLATRDVVLLKALPQCSDVEGRIVLPDAEPRLDYSSEAARILAEARAG